MAVKSENKYFIYLWLINPFLASLSLIRNFSRIKVVWPFLLLSFFFGISFVVVPGSGADSESYAYELGRLYEQQYDFSSYLTQLYSEDSGKLDIYQPLITWLVSFFTGNYQFLFAIFATVFGFFWFKNLMAIRSLMSKELGVVMLLSFVLLALINPIWSINGVRMWTAIQIFFYGLIYSELLKRRWGLFFIIASIFVHWSLTVLVLLYFIYKINFIKNGNLFFVIYVITFFVGELDLDIFRLYFEQLPAFLQSREGYLNEAVIERRQESEGANAVHMRFHAILMRFLMVFLASLTFIWVNVSGTSVSKKIMNWFLLSLYFAGFSNLVSQIPSGARYAILSNLLIVSSFLITFHGRWLAGRSFLFLRTPLVLILLFIIVVEVRKGFNYTGLLFFAGNPVVNLFFNEEVPVIEYIKSIF